MNPNFLYRWIRWLLPLLVARALVPAGFMLSVDAHGFALTFCPSVVSGSTEHHAAAPGPGAAGHEHEHEHHGRGHEAGKLCPFALAASGCAVDVPHLAASVDRPSFAPVPFESASLSSIPLRAERIRGPPAVS